MNRLDTRNERFPDGRKVRIMFAGGSRGQHVRADGQGGLLKRGWYYRHMNEQGQPLNGPFATLTHARNVALQLQ